jgi:regulatory protein
MSFYITLYEDRFAVTMQDLSKTDSDSISNKTDMGASQTDYKLLLAKIIRYCSYRERCEYEAVQKIRSWGADNSTCDMLIGELENSEYLNDNRFACSYAGSKFRVNGWGKIKIAAELKNRKILPSVIQIALKTIDEEEYHSKLYDLLTRKNHSLNERVSARKKMKVMNYGLSKGYEKNIVFLVMDRIFTD